MPPMIMNGTHDSYLVILSLAVAAFASFTALSLAGRIRASQGQWRRVWLAAAAVTLGGGIWSMHFVAMLAFSMPGMTMSYDPGLTVGSLALAIGFTAAGLATIDWQHAASRRTGAAGLLIATGVVAMHYVGMAAMRMPATVRYDPRWVTLSVAIAVVAATAAVWLASREQGLRGRVLAAGVMGAAIAGMHYAGMYAATFTASAQIDAATGVASVGQAYLAVAISIVTILILLLSLGAARVERAFQGARRREARSALRLEVADILRGDDAEVALSRVAELLGTHFRVARAGFGDLDPEADVFDYRLCWTDGSVPRLTGRFPAAAFGRRIAQALGNGETVVIDDIFSAALSDEQGAHDTARLGDTRAILVVPFVRDGRLRTIVYLNSRQPRAWRSDEVTFMEEIADRIRLVIERVRAEAQLRELNATLEARVDARTRELRLAEQARRETDELYRAYFENAPDPLFVIGVAADGGFVVEQVNPAHERGVGYPLEQIRGKRIDDILPRRAAERVIGTYHHVVATRAIHRYREVVTLGGVPQHWDTTLVPLQGPDGAIVKVIGSSRDITAQVSAEDALRQSQKMEAMGQLTGGVAHDFNNLLTPIMGVLDRLHRKGMGDERDRRLIGGALQSAERARVLVQRLLSFARRQPLQPVPVDVAALVTGIVELVASAIGPTVRIEVAAPDGLPAALADANQLEMALLNLSVNARDAMPDGGTLRIAVDQVAVTPDSGDRADPGGPPAGQYVCLTVTDTGVGMDDETRLRAIEPFFSTKGVGRGTGLGLSMAHGLAAQLGGALTIESRPNQGTTIALWLPQSAQVAIAAPPLYDVTAPERGGSALLVDDEDAVRESAAQMLADLGFAVTSAASAEEAWGLIERGFAPDLLVTDHVMPGMTGGELAAAVRDRTTATKVLIISGYAEEGGIPATLSRLTKPFVQADLAAALRRL
ncbi:MHYT domain-containing protein [Sphingomonas sp. NBWT7]|uniref:MHYT domain-containing protein n=1 Tax=Sphingomonas sp. NBWT7 TaxID=2596913 RepID=UPI001623F97B|nr:MHYT domain-containing protein [Sphingomonas sp. NBWT7]